MQSAQTRQAGVVVYEESISCFPPVNLAAPAMESNLDH